MMIQAGINILREPWQMSRAAMTLRAMAFNPDQLHSNHNRKCMIIIRETDHLLSDNG